MRRYLAYILALIVAVVIGVTIARDPGFAVFHYQNTTVTMPLWLFVLFVIVAFIIIIWILRIFDKTRFTFQKIHYWRENKKLIKIYEKSQRGLLEMMEGRYKAAEHHLKDSFKKDDAPLVNYLSAAQVAHELGAYDRRDTYLLKAKKRQPDAEVAINIAKAQLQLDQGDLSEAEFTLNRLKRSNPKHETVLKLLKELYTKQKNWPRLLDLMPSLERHHVVNKTEAETIKIMVFKIQMKQVSDNPGELKRVWNDFPKNFRHNIDLISEYIEHLLINHENDTAYDLLSQTLKKEWDAHLIRLYGLTHYSKPEQQFNQAEKWLKKHSEDAELLLVLGQIAMRLKLWGKARTYLENSIEIQPHKMAYQLLGELLEQLGEKDLALTKFKQGFKY